MSLIGYSLIFLGISLYGYYDAAVVKLEQVERESSYVWATQPPDPTPVPTEEPLEAVELVESIGADGTITVGFATPTPKPAPTPAYRVINLLEECMHAGGRYEYYTYRPFQTTYYFTRCVPDKHLPNGGSQ